MWPWARRALIFLILLVPSAQFAWRNRLMPQFAYLHDDGLLFISARSLTSEGGYRISSLPENPSQTKFPPLYPLYLSLIWRINPHFPDNLPLASLLSWLVLVAFLALAWTYFGRAGFSKSRSWLLVGLLAANPYVILFGATMFSDVFFACWVLAVFLTLSRGGARMALIAGVLAGCAYLSRTAGIALLISVPAWMAWRKEWRRAGYFLAGMLPAVAGLAWWTRAHALHSADPTLVYYTDYIRYYFNLRLESLPVVIWKNLDQTLYSMGSMVLPRVFDPLPVKILTQVIAVAMIAGTVRLARRGIGTEYALFGLASAGILLVWDFPATERNIVPLYPLLVAGLIAEIEHMGRTLKAGFRARDAGQRVAAGVFSAGAAAALVAAVVLQAYVTFGFLHQMAAQKRAKLADLRAAYAWISQNVPASANVLSYDDPLLYLYTGRHGNYLPLNPLWWYEENHSAIQGAYRDLAAYCRGRGLQYVFFTTEDLERETGDEDRLAVSRLVEENPELKPVFHAGIGTVYKLQ